MCGSLISGGKKSVHMHNDLHNFFEWWRGREATGNQEICVFFLVCFNYWEARIN